MWLPVPTVMRYRVNVCVILHCCNPKPCSAVPLTRSYLDQMITPPKNMPGSCSCRAFGMPSADTALRSRAGFFVRELRAHGLTPELQPAGRAPDFSQAWPAAGGTGLTLGSDRVSCEHRDTATGAPSPGGGDSALEDLDDISSGISSSCERGSDDVHELDWKAMGFNSKADAIAVLGPDTFPVRHTN